MISDNGFYGMISGLATTILLQPFENIKMALMIPPHRLQQLHIHGSTMANLVASCKYINEKDGVKGYYKGLVAASMKAAMGCYIYFTGLRYFQEPSMTAIQNFVVSSCSRIISTFLTNPLNIIQTRFQLAYFHGYHSIGEAVSDIYKRQGFRGFFSGALTSCIKEGTFGGFHYMFYEELKALGVDKIIAGISSGMLATAITHPFEIIRAKLQTIGLTEHHQFKQHLILMQFRKLRKEGGWTIGLAPRLVKKPVANMLTFLFFQIFQDRQDKVGKF